MYRIMRDLIIILCVAGSVVRGREVLKSWDFEDAPLEGWRCKSNAEMDVARSEAQGQYFRGTIHYGEYSFGWFSSFFDDFDLRQAWAVEMLVLGDGGGGNLSIMLGREWPKRAIYYVNEADAVALDFKGWRKVRFLLPNFATPSGRDREEDLARIFFLEIMIRGRDNGKTVVGIDDIRIFKATTDQQTTLNAQFETARLLKGPPATDGSNILPNAGFEQDVGGDGQPDLWTPNTWNTGSRPFVDHNTAHSGSVSVAVQNESADQRGSWDRHLQLTPGWWVFRAWCRTESLDAAEEKGADARLTLQDDDRTFLAAYHARTVATRGEWRQVEVSFEAPADIATAALSLFNFFAKGTVWWDDVHLGVDTEAQAAAVRRERENQRILEEVQTMLPQATQAIADLEARAPDSDDAKLLISVLTWALGDATRDADAGLGGQARQTLTDVLDLCTRADEVLRKAAEFEHPPQQDVDDGNPYIERLNAQLNQLVSEDKVYPKGDAGYRAFENAWTFRRLGENCMPMVWGLIHPRSEHYHDPRLVRNLMVNYDAITRNHRGGDFNPGRQAVHGRDPNINRFCISPMMDSLLMLEEEYPWLILPSKRREWMEELRVLVEHQYETYGPREPLDPERPRYYPNMDVHYLLIMQFAYKLFGDEKYRRDRDTILQWLDDALFEDGGWTYHWPQNECYVYHALNVTFIARYFELTGDERARRILDKSRGYYPLVHDTQGMTESYTDCSWKHYWTRAHPHGPDLIAGMFNDRENKRAALDASHGGYASGLAAVYTAPWWRDIEPSSMPDEWLVYDRNILGPRGQNGVFRFAGTGRLTPLGEIGKDTFVGCMIGDAKTRGLPLDAALQVATVEYRLKADGRHWQNARYCSSAERFSIVQAPEMAALCVTYRLSRPAWGHKSSLMPWEAEQQWFLCGRRLLGMLTVRPLEDTSCAGVWGRLRFGMHKDIEKGQNGLYKMGGLVFRVLDHNFADISTVPSETFFLDEPEKFRSTELILKDAQAVSGKEPPFTYRGGESFHFVTEVLPFWEDLASDVVRIDQSGVAGFAFTENGRRRMLLHNTTGEPAHFSARIDGEGALLWQSGTEPRSQQLTCPDGDLRVRLAAGDALLVEVKP